MYIQITTRCNMSCEHCHYACGSQGQNMSAKTFKAALALAEIDGSVTIGGGEPTLHPNFWHFLMDAIVACDDVFMVTNGSTTGHALKLARLAERGVIGCALSQDYYHDPIDYKVIQAFTRKDRTYSRNDNDDLREIRDVTTNEERLSLFRDPADGGNEDECICGGLFIAPNGDVKPCGCRTSPVIGHVSSFDLCAHINAREDSNGCYKDEAMYCNQEQEAEA